MVNIFHVLGQVPSQFLLLDQQGTIQSTKCDIQKQTNKTSWILAQ